MNSEEKAKIYLKAAEMVFEEKRKFCCDALRCCTSAWHNDEELMEIFSEFALFRPRNAPIDNGWWSKIGYTKPEHKEPRVLALLFAYQMCINP